MAVHPQRAIQNLKELRSLTTDELGAQRVAWTPQWQKTCRWFEEKLNGIPVEHHYDPAGNCWATLRGRSDRTLILGSHLDSVPNGGWLDGCLGVLAGLEVIQSLAEDGEPDVTVRLVSWADEEGARFGRSLFGSSAFAGSHSIEVDRKRTDKDGVPLAEALRSCDVDLDHVGNAARERGDARAYLELHIEQGPVLEQLQRPLGVVLGTKGVERHRLTFHGQEAHAGSTPMRERRDALAAAARLALEIRSIAGRHPDAVATIGSVKTFPGIVTAIVGRCEVTLDMRDLDAHRLACMLAEARAASDQFALEEGCTVEWTKIWSIEPIPFNNRLIAFCEDAIEEVAGVPHRLPSGPLHDAAEIARMGIPTTMMFVQSLAGLSHNAAEDTRLEHLEMAIRAFDSLARRTAAWIRED